jgi:hypothetical protein
MTVYAFSNSIRPYTSAVDQATETLEADAVFVDPTGRRRLLVRTAGAVAGCVLAAYLGIVAVGLVIGTDAPLTPWPDVKPSQREALPGNGGRPHKRAPSGRAVTGSAPATAPTVQPTGVPPRTVPGTAPTVAPKPTPTATQPGNGHAYGLTKSPNPRRP